MRAELARALLGEPDLLALDEPTNHLDIASREAVEAALQEFPGTMIVATHDRYLLERLATRVLTVDERGVSDFEGTYHELRRHRSREAARTVMRPRGRAAKPSKKGPRAAQPAKPTFDQIAAQIAAAEADLKDAAGWRADPDLYRDPERAKAMRLRYEEADRRLAGLYGLLDQVEDQTSG